ADAWLRLTEAEQLAGFGIAAGWVAVFAGGHPRQGRQFAPTEGRTQEGELLAHRLVILLGVQGALLANGVAKQQIEDGPRVVAQLAIAMDGRAGVELVLVANRTLGLLEQARGVRRLDLLELLRRGVRIFVLMGELAGGMVGADDETGDGIAGVRDLGDVPPGVGGIGGVNANGVAVAAADGLALRDPFLGPALVAKDQAVSR